MKKIIQYADPTKAVCYFCSHIVGEHHTIVHRRIAGGLFILVGVLIAHYSSDTSFHIVGDGVGYLIHGAGCMPFLEGLTNKRI